MSRANPFPIEVALSTSARLLDITASTQAAGLFAPFGLDGRTVRSKFARAPGVGNSVVTIWGDTSRYVYPSAPTIMSVSSTSVNDAVGGSGCQRLVILGLIVDFELAVEIVELNGQTSVPTALPWLRTPRAFAIDHGTGPLTENDGDIWIGTGLVTAGVPAVKHALIEAKRGQTLMAVDTVPAGKRFIITSAQVSVGQGQTLDADLFAREVGQCWRTRHNFTASRTFVPRNNEFPIILPEKTDIEIRGRADVANVDVSAGFSGYWEDVSLGE